MSIQTSESADIQTIKQKLGANGIIPVVALDDPELALPLGEALLAGGLPVAEMTFRTAAAPAAIRRMTRAYPEMLVGAGTVLTVEQAEMAAEAGARFFLAPGLDEEIADWCIRHDMLFLPGVMTPSDVSLAVKKGLRLLKFFPAVTAGGVPALKAIADPFVGVEFAPTGGINAGNLADFLRLPNVIACGGSWLVKKPLIQSGDFKEIARLTREGMSIVKQVQGEVP